jgi:hypothetical protein
MPDPSAVTVRFNGDSDDLLERFERARRLWVEEQGDDYERPIFYAACKTSDGIAVINAWDTQEDHQAFGRRLGPYLRCVPPESAPRTSTSICQLRSSAGTETT